jgi:hypothetical protein
MLISSLFVFSSITVGANDFKTITDDLNDVLDDTLEIVDMPNIDIKELKYLREGKKVTLKLTVNGVIEKKGNVEFFRLTIDKEYIEYIEELTANMDEIEIMEFLYNLYENLTGYTFFIDSSKNTYAIYHVNDETYVYRGSGDDYNQVSNTHSIDGDTLTVTFNLYSARENLSEISVSSLKIETSGIIDIDDFTGTYSDDLIAEANDDWAYETGNGGSSDSGSGLTFFIVLIVIIIIVGVAILVAVIRR